VTLLIAFFVTRHMLSADVAAKLAKGDTVELWGGAWSFSIKQLVDFLAVTVVPILAPVGFAIWARIKLKYQLLVVQTAPRALTTAEVKDAVSVTTTTTIIKTLDT